VCPTARILILTMFQDDGTVFAAMRAGARGYVLKDADKEDLLRAVQSVARGEAIFSPAVATRVLDYFSSPSAGVPRESFPMLTERERDLLQLLARGQSNAEIAVDLGLTTKTVSNYVSSILSKLQVADRAQAILRAREAGLG
jgi:DNA-binding NarL/FixJ family response regulator